MKFPIITVRIGFLWTNNLAYILIFVGIMELLALTPVLRKKSNFLFLSTFEVLFVDVRHIRNKYRSQALPLDKKLLSFALVSFLFVYFLPILINERSHTTLLAQLNIF